MKLTVRPLTTHVHADDRPLFVGELPGSIDLSRAIKLKELDFVCWRHCQWVTTILQNIIAIPGSRHLRRILLLTSGVLYSLADDEYPTALKNAIGETTYQEWLELDRLLPRLWESRSIKITLLYDVPYWFGEGARGCIKTSFPIATARGVVDLVQRFKF